MKPHKIAIYEVRSDAGSKLTAAMEFAKLNWRSLLRTMLYLVLPLCVVTSAAGQRYLSDVVQYFMWGSSDDDISMANSVTFVILTALSGLMTLAVTYGLMWHYEQGDDLGQLSLRNLWPILRRSLLRGALAWLTVGVMLIVAAVISFFVCAACFGIGLLAWPFVMLAIVGIMSLILPTYLLEDDISWLDATQKGVRYGLRTWKGCFCLSFMLFLIFSLLSNIIALPWILTVSFQISLFPDVQLASVVGLTLYKFLSYLLLIVAQFANCLALMFVLIVVAYQYGHAAEWLDSASVSEGIDRFESLADNNESEPTSAADHHGDFDDFDKL